MLNNSLFFDDVNLKCPFHLFINNLFDIKVVYEIAAYRDTNEQPILIV